MEGKIDSFIDKNKRLAIINRYWSTSLEEFMFHFEDGSYHFLCLSEIKRMTEMGTVLRWRARTKEIKCRNQF